MTTIEAFIAASTFMGILFILGKYSYRLIKGITKEVLK